MGNNLYKELRRSLNAHRYEKDHDTGLAHFPGANLAIGGVFTIEVNGQNPSSFHNLIVDDWLDTALDILFNAGSVPAGYYIAPYANNVSPSGSWDAATFVATGGEFTNYDEATRVEWTPAASSSGTVTNSASKAEFTIAASGDDTIWGAGILTNSAKSDTTAGTLVAANKDSAARSGLVDGDVVTITYALTLADNS